MKKLLFVIWILSVSAAFIIGNQTPSLFQEIQQQAEIEHVNKIAVKKKIVSNKNQSFTQRTASSDDDYDIVNNNAQSIEEVVSDLKSLLKDGFTSFSLPAIAESYNLIKDLSEQEIITALSLIELNSKNRDNLMLLTTLIGRYAELNPEASLLYINENISSDQTKQIAVNTVMSYWSKTDPVAAYYWSSSNEHSDLSDNANSISFGMMTIFNGLAKRDLYDAIEKLNEVEDNGQNTRMAAAGIAQAIEFKDDFIAFIAMADEIGNAGIKDTTIRNWANKNPQEAAEWVYTSDDQSNNSRTKSTVLSAWLIKQPREAADWYMGLADETSTQNKLNKIIGQWSYQSPQDALDWIDEQADIDYDKTIKLLLMSSASTNTNFAIKNMKLLSTDADKQNLSYDIYKTLNYTSKKQATAFLAKSPYKDFLQQKHNEAKQAWAKRNSG